MITASEDQPMKQIEYNAVLPCTMAPLAIPLRSTFLCPVFNPVGLGTATRLLNGRVEILLDGVDFDRLTLMFHNLAGFSGSHQFLPFRKEAPRYSSQFDRGTYTRSADYAVTCMS